MGENMHASVSQPSCPSRKKKKKGKRKRGPGLQSCFSSHRSSCSVNGSSEITNVPEYHERDLMQQEDSVRTREEASVYGERLERDRPIRVKELLRQGLSEGPTQCESC